MHLLLEHDTCPVKKQYKKGCGIPPQIHTKPFLNRGLVCGLKLKSTGEKKAVEASNIHTKPLSETWLFCEVLRETHTQKSSGVSPNSIADTYLGKQPEWPGREGAMVMPLFNHTRPGHMPWTLRGWLAREDISWHQLDINTECINEQLTNEIQCRSPYLYSKALYDWKTKDFLFISPSSFIELISLQDVMVRLL